MSKDVSREVKAAHDKIDFEKHRYQVQIDTTMGPILLDLFPDVAPGHCKNLIALADIGFYDGVTFHRVVKGFVIQGGCPHGNGTGGPGYTINAEFNEHPHEPGVLSMARTNDPHSAGSQFFLCLEKVPSLDRQYTVFGKTANAESLATVRKIGGVATDANDRPTTPVKMTKATVLKHAI